jgi:hypothetical protein
MAMAGPGLSTALLGCLFLVAAVPLLAAYVDDDHSHAYIEDDYWRCEGYNECAACVNPPTQPDLCVCYGRGRVPPPLDLRLRL